MRFFFPEKQLRSTYVISPNRYARARKKRETQRHTKIYIHKEREKNIYRAHAAAVLVDARRSEALAP